MPGGGLVQVVARGNQDHYLTSKPDITFFKELIEKHTVFASESIEQVFNGTGDFNKKVVCALQRNGDLVTKMYLKVTLPALSAGQCWCPRVGYAMIKRAELNCGGTTLEEHTGDWFNVQHNTCRDAHLDRVHDEMIGDTEALTVPGEGTLATTLYIPLNFSCCRHNANALPYVATQFHDYRVEIELNPLANLVCGRNASSATGSLSAATLMVDYVFLGKVERTKFAESIHEYLIEQVQDLSEGVNATSQRFRIAFNHPVKALHVNVQQTKYTAGNAFLAWNPKDWHAMQIQATKRAALAWGTLNTSTGIYEGNSSISDAGFKAAITAARVAPVDISGAVVAGDADATMVLGYPLDMRYCSMTITELGTLVGNSVTRGTTGDASANYDITVRDWCNYGTFLDRSVNPVSQMLISLNNQDRLSRRDGMYYNYVQSWQHFNVAAQDGLNSHSFAINPCNLQPSGTVNMSRIDNASIHLEFITTAPVRVSGAMTAVSVTVHSAATCNIYGPNYNVFRVMGGMGGMGFAA
jgi:hypothetical protein